MGNSVEVDLSLRHLRAELARMDVRLRREVQRWQRAGPDPAHTFRGAAPGHELGAKRCPGPRRGQGLCRG
jgi:hypothetical protein